ncbi:MAG: acetate/propionate family kinase [Clostridiaceae bacterium]
MKILVINCGSSSIKYQLFNMEDESVLAKGLVERIGLEGAILTHKVNDKKYETVGSIPDHKEGVRLVLNALVDKEYGVLKDMNEISAVGHRVVHAGEKYSKSVLIDSDVMKSIEECVKLAPLHNPPNITGINACKELMKDTPMVAVFDTAFHQTMPAYSYIYPIPYEYYTELGVRRYGFHGTSHKYISNKAAEILGKKIEDLKIVTCHLGNGSSVAAIKDGKSLDTSMGFTPLEGLAMGTRSGDVDPSIVTYLMKEKNFSPAEMEDVLNKKSGFLGVSGISSDCRDIEVAAAEGNKNAELALKIFTNRIKQYIGSYAATMGGLDVVIFAGGIGENSSHTREEVMSGLEFFGFELDKEANKSRGKLVSISTENSKVKVLVIPTDEELMIARDTKDLTVNK